MLRIATANVNGIRAAQRRGVEKWLADRAPDVLCLQEVRAPDEVLRGIVGESWHGVHEEASAKGRAGVAVLSRVAPVAVRTGLGAAAGAGDFAGSGRWVEADFAVGGEPGLLTVVSVYVHKGEAGAPKQQEKYRFLGAVHARMRALAVDGRHLVVCGDVNIAHREADLKNWKGNLTHAGFLPEERAWMDGLLGDGAFVDVHRALVGDVPGPYTWWSWRGKAFDTDSGWRIDYQFATPGMASRAVTAEVDRARSYAERWSDHAAVVIDYDCSLGPL
ncbi:MAG: exodeoxyribonuclease III [Actinomycetales bacterium]|nr:exodeoxyribonuclease III [Actinomycetales bacterium]